MSGGLILAALHKEREIEYIRRGVTLTPELMRRLCKVDP